MSIRDIAFRMLLLAMCSGCGPSRQEQIYGDAVEYLQDNIIPMEREVKSGEANRLVLEYSLPLARSVLSELQDKGPKFLEEPVITLAILKQVSSLENKGDQDRAGDENGMLLCWLESGREMTGFFFQLESGELLEFPNVCDPNDEHFINLSKDNWPERYTTIAFWDSGTDDVLLTPEQRREIIQDRTVRRVGLILKDGTKSKTAPVAYYGEYESKGFAD